MRVSDAPSHLVRPIGSPVPMPPAAVPAPASVFWPPWLRRVAGMRRRATTTSVTKPPTVRLIQPQVRTIVRVVGQPSFTQSYERSSVYPKMNAYIKKWIVDIGDRVKKGDALATLFVPELVEDHGTKKATVVLDQERIALANAVVEVAQADVEAAVARLEEARAELAGNAGRGRGAGTRRPSGSTTSSREAWSIPRMSFRPPIGGRRPSRCGTRRRRPC